MSAPLSPRAGRRRHRAVDAGAAVLLLCLAVTLSAFAPASGPRGERTADRPVAGAVAAAPQPAVPGAPAATAPVAAVAPGATPRPAVRTVSMDEPIQGGLTARQAQAASSAVLAAHDEPASAAQHDTWTPAMGRTAVARARSWLGMPYSWAGGTASGPTPGRCDPAAGADLDCRIVGFDCSGLTMYAWGPYAGLPHYAQTQRDAGEFHPTLEQLQPGDLVFFSGYLPGGIGHVAIYEGHGTVIEAPQSGSTVRRSPLRELLAEDGTYRGAVRPLTTATPVLAPQATTVSTRGGTVTLRGEHLLGIESVTVGDEKITRFARHTDTAVTFRAPGAAAGRQAVTARTAWGATSRPVSLTYVRPALPRTVTPTKPAPVRTTPPVSTPPVSTPPVSTPPATTPPTQTAPASTAPGTTAPPATASTSLLPTSLLPATTP